MHGRVSMMGTNVFGEILADRLNFGYTMIQTIVFLLMFTYD